MYINDRYFCAYLNIPNFFVITIKSFVVKSSFVVSSTSTMKKLTTVLLFCFIGVNYAPKTEGPKILEEKSATKQEAVEALSEIQPKDVLPLPLVLYEDQQNKPQLPSELETVAIIDGKMVHGTIFSSEASSDQMFLCPEKNSQTNCLVRQDFKHNNPLRCNEEVIPHVDYKYGYCGAGGTGQLYESFYEICDSQKDKLDLKEVKFYDICYDENGQESLFSHHTIISPRLLNSVLLFRERKVKYEMRDDLKLSNNKVKTNSQQGSTKSAYQEQKLVPSEDMALGLWRKITFQRANTALQHKELVDLWDEICDHIRRRTLYNTEIMDTEIYTGVFYTGFVSKDTDTQIYNIWVKLIYYYHEDPRTGKKSLQPNDGVVVLMNNFIDTKTVDATKSSLDEPYNLIDQYCEKDYCVEYLKLKFQHVRGRIRCCPVTKEILTLFGRDDDPEPKLSSILYVTTNQETLFENRVTEEQVVYSLREIQPNEVLPIVLFTWNYYYHPVIPHVLHKTGIMNSRIMSSIDFMAYSGKQTFFCPNISNDKKCLKAVEFNGSKFPQCTNDEIPMIEKLQEDRNQCGQPTDGGTLYRLCPISKNSKNPYRAGKLAFYTFCYNANRQKILFASHRIKSPNLLFSKLLMRERSVEYAMKKDEEFPLSDLQEFENAANPLVPEESNTKKSVYKLQKLVPPEDMAFAKWRKLTYKYVNVEWQHEKLIPLWNEINSKIRDYAYAWNSRENGDDKNFKGIAIFTGVFQPESTSKTNVDGQKSNIWIKIIYEDEGTSYKGTAILMNNFLEPKKNMVRSLIKRGENTLKKYCEKNLCTKSLQDKFEEIGGRIRCCPLTNDIIKLFNTSEITSREQLVKITHITD